MGCDIHAVLQKRDETTSEWKTVLYDVIPSRNYQLFGILAGVRGAPYTVMIGNTGLPDDFEVELDGTITTHNGYWMGDHSFGYIDLKEILVHESNYGTNSKSYKEAVAKFIADIDQIELGEEDEWVSSMSVSDQECVDNLIRAFKIFLGEAIDYRIVYGFDN